MLHAILNLAAVVPPVVISEIQTVLLSHREGSLICFGLCLACVCIKWGCSDSEMVSAYSQPE